MPSEYNQWGLDAPVIIARTRDLRRFRIIDPDGTESIQPWDLIEAFLKGKGFEECELIQRYIIEFRSVKIWPQDCLWEIPQ